MKLIQGILPYASNPLITVYAVTKGVMNQLTKNLACEWAKDNIRTNCVVPGATITVMLQPDASDLSGDDDTDDDGKDVGDKF